MSANYDNWERLVAAVLKKVQLWQLFHEQSRSPSIRSEASDSSSSSSFDLSYQDLAFDFTSLGISSKPQKAPPKLILVSDFGAAFDVEDVYLARAELLGRGTFGSAYTAEMENGVKIVVKRLDSANLSELEFKGRVEIVGNVRHENVVALRAYYASKDERAMLYDYYSDGSVFAVLHGQNVENRASVDWDTRLKIAIGAARGIAEIHTHNGGNLVHGNIKASNIFLNPLNYGCVSDLGLTNMITATFMPKALCYAPEIKKTQNVSQASDVYSFGILLLELITRKSPVNIVNGPKAVDLVKLVNSVKRNEKFAKVFDVDILKSSTVKENMVKMAQIGMSCAAKSLKKRPRMSEVVKMLEDLQMMNTESSNLNTKSGDIQMTNKKELVFVENGNHPFEFDDLLEASAEVLGKGTFGTSYKAILSETDVLVKRLKDVAVTLNEFHHHSQIIGRMRHGNVDRLRAYHFSKDEKLMVYDYQDRGSVSAFLHDKTAPDWRPLDWEARLKIAVGAAKGIAHIHRQDGGKFVHGNIKSSNIFLNGKKYGLVANAGLAKLMEPIRRSVVRNLGQFAPEVNDTSNVSQACDVYSFGVLLLELATGRPAQHTNEEGDVVSLVRWVQLTVREVWSDEVFDVEILRYKNVDEAMVQLLQIAMECVTFSPEGRPVMPQVVKMLEEISTGINKGEKPSIQSRLEDVMEDLLPSIHHGF
ncbi:hypothetical protein ACP275_06G047900 [Erythranthe tilingii]